MSVEKEEEVVISDEGGRRERINGQQEQQLSRSALRSSDGSKGCSRSWGHEGGTSGGGVQ
eukprot:756643-Hanusia_phi.AAC.1